ncbi:MAG TPA: hypothetical protein VM283_08000, partial [Armatimonadota bacterium]|nr:hypothetical protein [Armatimonadota bacterium]
PELPGTVVTTAPGVGARSLSGATPPRSIRSSPAAPRGSKPPGAQEVPSQHWTATTPAPRAASRRDPRQTRIQQLTEPVTDHDRLVITAVSSLTWGDDRPLTGRVSAMVDEYQGYAVVRVAIPPSVSSAVLKESVVKMAYRVALAAVRADESINAVTVQMVRAVESSSGTVMEIMWRGNASRRNLESHLQYADDPGTLLTQVFATVRWSAGLTPPPETGGTTPGPGESPTTP